MWAEETLPALTLTAGDDGLDASLPSLTLTAGTGGLDASLPVFTISATAAYEPFAVNDLPVFELEGGGWGAEITADNTFPVLELDASVTNEGVLQADNTLPAFELDASIGFALDETLPSFSLEASAEAGAVISADNTFPALLLDAVLESSVAVTLDDTLPAFTLSASIASGTLVTLDQNLPAFTLSAQSETGRDATFTESLPAFTLVANAYVQNDIVFDNTMPAFFVSAVMPLASAESNYRTWTLNLRNNALTEYTGFEFNSYAQFNGVVIAADETGLYELDGANDKGSAANTITGYLKTGKSDFESSFSKRVPRAYVSGKFNGDIEFHTIVEGEAQRKYLLQHDEITTLKQRRVPIGRGPKSRYWQFAFTNRAGADFEVASIIVVPERTKRRGT